MKDDKFIRGAVCIYYKINALSDFEVASSVGDVQTCKVLSDFYVKFCEDSQNSSTSETVHVRNAQELYFWVSENVPENIHYVIVDEVVANIAVFEKLCKEMKSRIKFDAATISPQMVMAFWRAFFALAMHIQKKEHMRRIAVAMEEIFASDAITVLYFFHEYQKLNVQAAALTSFMGSLIEYWSEHNKSSEDIVNLLKQMHFLSDDDK